MTLSHGVGSNTTPNENCLDFSELRAGLDCTKVLTWQLSSGSPFRAAQDTVSNTDSAENEVFCVSTGRLGARKPVPTEPRSFRLGMAFHWNDAFGEKSLP